MPLPFCRACFLWGEPIWVSPEADPVEMEAKRMELETALKHWASKRITLSALTPKRDLAQAMICPAA